MKTLTCRKCGKVIEGFSENHVKSMMAQHQLKHTRERDQLEKIKRERKQEKSDETSKVAHIGESKKAQPESSSKSNSKEKKK